MAKIEIIDIRNCEYQFADNSKIYCEAQFSHLFTVDGDGNKTYNWSNFTADPNDIEKHSRDIFANAENGDYGVVGDYTPPPESEVFSKEIQKLRLERKNSKKVKKGDFKRKKRKKRKKSKTKGEKKAKKDWETK